MKIRKAVITAAGRGTRFLPITKSQPKEMLPLVNKPLIQYSLEQAIACGVEMVVIVTSLGKAAIENYFDRSLELEQWLEQKGETALAAELRHLSSMVDICYVRQKQQMGLGHAVLTTRKIVGDEPFILLLPDDLLEKRELVLKKMQALHREHQASILAVKRVPREEVSRYGIIAGREVAPRVHQVTGLVEKPPPDETPSDLAIMGSYILTPDVFAALEKTAPGKNQEIQLTDALQKLRRTHPVYAYEFEGERYDVGTPAGWLETQATLALQDPEIGPDFRNYLKKLLAE